MRTLIIPCAGKSTRFPGMKPKWLLTHPDGSLMIEKSLSGVDIDAFDKVIITIVKQHAEQYEAEYILKSIFTEPKFKIHVLDDFTSSPCETIYKTLVDNNVQGAFIVKDSDNYVKFDIPDTFSNFVVGLDLNKFRNVSNITGKSFILLNEQDMLTDIIEKKVVSNIICVGVYSFKDVEEFKKAYFDLLKENIGQNELFISHIISYKLANRNVVFDYVEASGYEDWGTLQDWEETQKKHRTYFIDIDGVILKNTGKYGKINWSNNREIIPENIETIKKLEKYGAQIVLTTSRTEEYRSIIDEICKEHGLKYHALILGCNHSRRILINDFASTNPYPSCEAINIPRNGIIKSFLQ